MIDLSNVKAPGWARIVAELHAPAPDDRTFLHKLVAVLAQVSGARQGVLFAVERAEGEGPAPDPRPIVVWPPAPGEGTPEIEQPADARAAARAASDAGQLRVFGIDSAAPGFYGEPQDQGSIIAVPVPSGTPESPAAPGPQGVITLLVEPRSKQALQTTTALVEVLAGYTLLHATRQHLKRSRAATASLDLAARLIAALNTAPSFKGASLQLVNDLTRQMRADRVALGWVRGIGTSGAIRAVAMSDTELIDRRMAMVQKIEAAMDECLDQEQAVLYPPPPAETGEVALTQAITHAHRELGAADARLKVVSLPLRDGDKVVGVVTLESTAEGPADLASIELVQAALDLVAPVLVVKRSDDRALPVRAALSAARAGRWLVGPKHTGWKLAGVALFLAVLASVIVRVEYRVEAPMEIQPRTKFIIAAPFEGVIKSLPEGIEAGRQVRQGDTLVQMDTDLLKLQLEQARARREQARKEADTYLNSEKLGEYKQAQHRAEQAEAEIGQLETNVKRATLTAPIDGTIIAGDLSDKIGAAVKLGDVLFQVAPLHDMTVVARVSDRDIGLIRAEGDPAGPTTGEIATKANPALGYPFVVERIVPLAQPKDGKNAFEIRGRFTVAVSSLNPGLEGYAHLDSGRHSVMWILTRRIRDQLRLWLWW